MRVLHGSQVVLGWQGYRGVRFLRLAQRAGLVPCRRSGKLAAVGRDRAVTREGRRKKLLRADILARDEVSRTSSGRAVEPDPSVPEAPRVSNGISAAAPRY